MMFNNKEALTTTPNKEIRAVYNSEIIRVYQAYSDEIADSAVSNNTFVSPPFKMTRMTWIKPSFLWMMYRAGWGEKDNKQKRILAIDILHEGFLWAIENSCLSNFQSSIYETEEFWTKQKETSPVRIQWDPERDIAFNKLPYRTLQIGLSNDAVRRYTQGWIMQITDITTIASQIKQYIDAGDIDSANNLLPTEKPYSIPSNLAKKIGITV